MNQLNNKETFDMTSNMNNKYPEAMNSKNTLRAISILMLFLASFVWKGAEIRSQNNMGIGTLTPHPKALLQIENNLQNMGLLIPRMSTDQRDAITPIVDTTANGLLIYNTDCNVFNYYQFDHWVSINGLTISGGTIIGNEFPCQGSTAVYKVPNVPGNITYKWTTIPNGVFSYTGPLDSVTISIPSDPFTLCVTATNDCDDADSICININPATAALPPTALPPSSFTCTSVVANWSQVASAAAYLLDVSTDNAFGSFLSGFPQTVNGSNNNSYTLNGLTAGSTYFYRVRVINGCDTSSYSNTIGFTLGALTPPTATAASNVTCNAFTANWGVSSGATTYFLDVSTSSAFDSFVTSGGNTYDALDVQFVNSFSISGLTPNTIYYYRLRAVNSCDTSSVSNFVTVSLGAPIAPTATAASNFTCNPFTFQANWGAVSGAFSYHIDVSTDASFATLIYNDFQVISATSLIITTGVQANMTYYYRVRADNTCIQSQNSNTIVASTTAPSAPTATAASNFSCTSFNANWGAVSGATTYHLDLATDAAFNSPVFIDSIVGNVTTYNVTGLTPNTTYYYRVRADNGCSISGNSNTIIFGTTAPIAPTATPPSNFTCTSVNANWGAVSGAIQYYLDVSTDASFATFVGGYSDSLVGGVTTFNITGLVANTTYYYRVRADNGCSLSSYSNTVTFGTTAPIAPTATLADNYTCTSVNANWGSVSGAILYYLDVSTSSSFTDFVGGYSDTAVGNVTTFNVTGLVANTTYYYRVRADNGCSISAYSNTVTFGTTAPISPTATPADNFSCTSFNANWGSVPSATQYFIDVSTSNQFLDFVNNISDSLVGNTTTFNVTGLTVNTTYYYRVRSGNGCSVSLSSNTISVGTTAPISPTATPASNFTCTSMSANWGAVPGATNYILDVSTSASFGPDTIPGYGNLSVGNVTSYLVTGLTPNVTYHYRIRADNGCSISTYSNTISIGTTAPISPTATAANNFTCTSFNANWGAVSGATTYYLDVATDASFSPGTFVGIYNNYNTGNVTTLNITGLTPNVVYHYRVRADNGCSVSLNSNTISIGTTAPISPTATPADNFTCTSFNANWGAVPGAITYYLDVATDASFGPSTLSTYNNKNTGNVTTLNVTGLTPNVTYYYRLRADNGCSISLYSNTISAGTTAPISPTATAATNLTCVSFNANWGAVSGAINYLLDVSTDVSFTSISVLSNQPTANVTTYNVTGLTPGTTYYYRVRADNGCLVSLNSNTITVGTTAPVPPTATPADNFTCTSFNANWGAVTGATNYFLDVSTDVSFTVFSVLNNQSAGSATTYNVTGLTPNTTYYYRVRASNGCLTSINSNTITVGTTAPVPPTATDADNFTCTSFNANWGAVTGATSYFLDVSTDVTFGTFSVLNNQSAGSATTYNVTGLTVNTTYYYRVRASNGCSTSLNSNTITVGTTAPVAPTATDADNFTCTSFNANWGAVTGATSYLIDVSTTANFSGTLVLNGQSTGNATTYNVTGLTPNTTYFYRVRASNGCSTSLNSNTITVGTTAPVAPTATDANNFTCNSFNANWGAVTGATSYIIEVSTTASFTSYQGTYSNLNVGDVTTLNVTGLTTGVVYYYRIKASNGCSTSLVSNTITVSTSAPVAPNANPADNFTCTSFNANWGAVTGATSYIIEVSTSASFTSYQGTYSNLNVGDVTTLNVTGLTTGTVYYYRIKASNGCSTSLVSNTITVSTTAPVAPTATDASNFTCTSFNANWGAVTGATSYIIEVSTSASFTSYQGTYNNLNIGDVTTLNVTGLTTGVVYYYRIKASNGCSTSLVSNTITVSTTAPVAHTATDASNFTCTSFNANWGAVTGATSYIIEVSTSASFTSYQGTYSNLNVGDVTTLN
ncbi:MAG: fibronectin type III domain-containing protein, partial [Bacteroidia bacterium]